MQWQNIWHSQKRNHYLWSASRLMWTVGRTPSLFASWLLVLSFGAISSFPYRDSVGGHFSVVNPSFLSLLVRPFTMSFEEFWHLFLSFFRIQSYFFFILIFFFIDLHKSYFYLPVSSFFFKFIQMRYVLMKLSQKYIYTLTHMQHSVKVLECWLV